MIAQVTTGRRSRLLRAFLRPGCNWVLTHWVEFPCSIHIGALVPRRSATAGVPGPRRNADDCDAGWFAPVATRRRPVLRRFWRLSPWARSVSRGDDPPEPPLGPLLALVLGVGLLLWASGLVSVWTNGRWYLGPRSFDFSGRHSDQRSQRILAAAREGRTLLAVIIAYSVRWNSAIATRSIARPMAATIARDRPRGTTQPFQVTPGLSSAMAAEPIGRWSNTA